MVYRIFVLIQSLLIFVFSFLSSAQSIDTTYGEQTGLNKMSFPTAMRIGVTNSLIEFVNNASQVTLELEWEYLPESEILLNDARQYNVNPVTISIANEKLGDPGKWIKDLNGFQQQILSKALMIPELEKFSHSETYQRFLEYWTNPDSTGMKLIGTAVSGSQYYSLLRDHNLMTFLLGSKGIVYSLNVTGAEKSDDFPKLIYEGIKWQIKIYEFKVSPEASFYRFTAKVKKHQKILFPFTDEIEAKLSAGISFKKSEITVGLPKNIRDCITSSEIDIALRPSLKDTLSILEKEKADNTLETILNFASGGVKLGDIITKGLLAGTQNASIVTGALIDKNNVDQMVGVNWEISPKSNISLGGLLGIVPQRDYSIFTGASIRFSVFTFGLGANIFEEKKSDSEQSKTKINIWPPSGILSIDLSRISRSKKKETKIRLDNSYTGGGWGKVTDMLAQDLVFIKISLTAGEGITDEEADIIKLKFRQITDSKFDTITDTGQQARFNLKVSDASRRIRFVPRGTYAIEGIPDGFALKSGVFNADAGDTVRIMAKGIQEMNYKIVRD